MPVPASCPKVPLMNSWNHSVLKQSAWRILWSMVALGDLFADNMYISFILSALNKLSRL